MSSGWIDTSELLDLAADLMTAQRVEQFEATMHRAGNNIKRDMKADSTGHRHLPGLASTVGYDLYSGGHQVTVEVGFAKKGQGNLATFAAYGSVNNAPVMDITRGLRAELPNVEKWLARMATGWLK